MTKPQRKTVKYNTRQKSKNTKQNSNNTKQKFRGKKRSTRQEDLTTDELVQELAGVEASR